ncbi:MAG: iron-containing redox enzyme family protein, partial [Chloroflexota bacterium]
RRDCWGYVQGGAPLDVKRLVWAHEQEELVLDPHVGMDHFTLATREAEVLGLTATDFEQAEAFPGSSAAFYAWTYLAKDRPWLEAVTASSVLEVRNSAAVVEGGSLSSRIRQKLVNELGLPAEKLINVNRHSVADEEHANLLERVVSVHVATEGDRQAVLRGARASFLIDRAFRGALAAGMSALD